MTGATKTLGALQDEIEGLTTGQSVTITAYTNGDSGLTEGYLKSYEFFQGETSLGKIDIPKDLVVTSGQVTVDEQDRKVLRLTIANQAEPVDILVSDLAHVYTEGNGIEISNADVISAKVVAANGLSVDANGIAMAAASSNGAGAMSSADFDKLAGVASGAQVNVLEGVQVNGTDLTPDANKKVNIVLGSAASANTTDFDAAGAAEAASAAAITAVVGTMSGDTKTLGALQEAIADLSLGDTNVIEGVQVNGTDLTPDANKKVNIELGSAAFSAATDFDLAGAAGAASAAAVTEVVGTASSSGSTLGALETRMDNMDLGDHNVIETVQVNGSDLTPDADKKVNVTITSGTADGTIAVNGTDVAVAGLGSAAFEDTTAFDEAGAAAAASAAAYSSATSYADAAVAAKNVAASGDTYINATASANTVFVTASQTLLDAVTAANGAVQGISSGNESGVQLDSNNELDFSGLGIDCGTY